MRVCAECGKSYPSTAEHFIRSARARDGLTRTCRPCRRALLESRRPIADSRIIIPETRLDRDIEATLTREEIAAAGQYLDMHVTLADGAKAKVAGRRGSAWVVRLEVPMKINEFFWSEMAVVRDVFVESIPD